MTHHTQETLGASLLWMFVFNHRLTNLEPRVVEYARLRVSPRLRHIVSGDDVAQDVLMDAKVRAAYYHNTAKRPLWVLIALQGGPLPAPGELPDPDLLRMLKRAVRARLSRIGEKNETETSGKERVANEALLRESDRSAEDIADRNRNVELLFLALLRLQEVQRIVLLSRYVLGLSFQEISDQLVDLGFARRSEQALRLVAHRAKDDLTVLIAELRWGANRYPGIRMPKRLGAQWNEFSVLNCLAAVRVEDLKQMVCGDKELVSGTHYLERRALKKEERLQLRQFALTIAS